MPDPYNGILCACEARYVRTLAKRLREVSGA